MRIYIPYVPDGTAIEIDGDNFHYMKNVLRITQGKQFTILTDDCVLNAEVSEVLKKSINVNISDRRSVNRPQYSFTVYQCVLKREYMDYVIEKYTELGVTDIIPVYSDYSVGEVKENTARRYKEIVKAAALQSEQEFLANVHGVEKISSILPITDKKILFYERGEISGFPVIENNSVSIIIGPEGGFSPDEIKLLISKGFISYTPLSSILKAETAAVVFAGAVRMQLK